MNCVVCRKPAVSRSPYCARCRPLIVGVRGGGQLRLELRRSYDARIDAFRCQRSGVLLVLDDPTDPFHFRWDHYGPGSSGAMEVTCELFASMRAGLSGLEFEELVFELAAHRRPFPKIALDPRGWPERWHPREAAGGSECVVCGKPAPARARYCPRCREFVSRGGSGASLRVAALKKAWRPEEDGFACHYTGVVLDHGGPWGVAFDERVPGSTVVAAEWVRRMKRGLSEGELRAVVREERRHLRTGRPFDRYVAKFEHWRGSAPSAGGSGGPARAAAGPCSGSTGTSARAPGR